LFTFKREYLLVVSALVIFSFLAYWLNFTQDDSYISYRYVTNFLNGNGLVYNIGERVEGFTNFGWVVYMILWGGLGVSYIFISKITGFFFGVGVILLTYLIAKEIFPEKQKWFRFLPVFLVGINQSLAYWSPAGLETATFVFFSTLAVLWFLKRSWLLIFALLMVVWIRPDGVIVAGLLLGIEGILEKRIPRFSLFCGIAAFCLSLPFVIFKLVYFGSILPNPFFAKTGLSMTYLRNGLEYAAEFFQHYGFVGLGVIIPLFYFRKLSFNARSLWLFLIGFSCYIILIGGDVLKVHRFFLPVVGVSGILVTMSLQLLVNHFTRKTQNMCVVIIGAGLITLSIYLPSDTVKKFNFNEKAFTDKMGWTAREMEKWDSSNFSVATPTIGIFGYELIGHEIIDMLGLTDSTIARYSEAPIQGMATTWKETRHNSKYVLSRAPDYILFSTGIKPSAPAEKALFLYPQFMDSYRSVGWLYKTSPNSKRGLLSVAFKKMRPITGDIVPSIPVEFVEYYNNCQNAYGRGDYRGAVDLGRKALASLGQREPSVELMGTMGYCLINLNDMEGVEILNKAVFLDSLAYGPHKDLYSYEMVAGDRAKAAIHRKYLEKLVPWYLPRLDSLVNDMLTKKDQSLKD
jgi:arabinofuranosyltransferase